VEASIYSFTARITKKIGAIDMRDFRPINLLGSVYKILAKNFDK